MRVEAEKKTFLSCVNEQIYISFGKFTKRINLEWNFKILTFASQRKLLELLSCGEYNQKQLIICSSFLVNHFFFLISKNVQLHNFLLLNNIDHSNSVLKTLNNIYINKF